MSLGLPKYELYEEGSQRRRSSKGIASCVVEGYVRRRYKADFIKFLIYAHASCDETILHLDFINDTHVFSEKEMNFFLDSYNELGRKLNKFSTLKKIGSNFYSQPVTRNSVSLLAIGD